MKVGILTISLCLSASIAAAQEANEVEKIIEPGFEGTPPGQSPYFDPHLAVNPDTVEHLHLNYEPFPGSLMSQRTIFGSTLALGLGDRFEIGTVPIFYFLNAMNFISWNLTAKYNFIRLPYVSVAAGYHFHYYEHTLPETVAVDDLKGAKRGYVRQHGASVLTAFTLSPRLSAGFTLSGSLYQARLTFKDEASKNDLSETNHWHEEFADLNYRWSDSTSVSGGLSRTLFTRELQDASERNRQYEWGFGPTITWRRPRQFLSRPSIGVHHLTRAKENLILLSTEFY